MAQQTERCGLSSILLLLIRASKLSDRSEIWVFHQHSILDLDSVTRRLSRGWMGTILPCQSGWKSSSDFLKRTRILLLLAAQLRQLTSADSRFPGWASR